MEKVVIALGGNALQESDDNATAESQLAVIKKTAGYLGDLIEEGYDLVVAHGNGPQVGRILIQNEVAKDATPAMPLDVCGSMSQGMIGYHMQQAIGDELRSRGINRGVTSLVTQVVVNKEDKAFANPTKPIGPFYSQEEAERLRDEKGYSIVEDSGRGYRRVVASPVPERIVELDAVKALIDANQVVITVGGGGIPVVETANGTLEGAAAVIDKDLASERLAEDLDADILVILTAVERVAINFGKPDQREVDKATVAEMKQFAAEGHFPPGSMLPKVEAAIKFAESKPGRKTIIASLDKAREALRGESGTIVEV
ncbi:MAG: carbamate kinase [Clostridiaceae bacterium]|nr:carbamate kinase [Clostridiaceae bacterium]